MRLHCGSQRPYIRFELGCLLADERAAKEVVSCKGASGTKPCCRCKNVVGRAQPEAAGYLVHFGEADPGRFDLHTGASFLEMADELQSKVGQPVRAFSRLEHTLGLTYHPRAAPMEPLS